ncbi:MAG TPA: hypothetical protein VHX17_04625 [Candidatus Cybelea sp.]|nr:hypothetical protein [Candidatus Cybelea sp.]
MNRWLTVGHLSEKKLDRAFFRARLAAEYVDAGLGNYASIEKVSLAVVGQCGVHRGFDTHDPEADWLIEREYSSLAKSSKNGPRR